MPCYKLKYSADALLQIGDRLRALDVICFFFPSKLCSDQANFRIMMLLQFNFIFSLFGFGCFEVYF